MGNPQEVTEKPNLERAQSTCVTHLGETGALNTCLWGNFGSDHTGGDARVNAATWGAPADEIMLEQQREENFPGFCGGVQNTDSMDHEQDINMMDGAPHQQTTSPSSTCSSLDYVVQNLQCRLGNYRNRCFANGPFRLWAWAGSFMQGKELWQGTTSAVTTALGDDGVVNITTLETLAPLWETFNEAVQDDAAHFLQQLVHLASSKKVITQYHHVDHRQEVHLRAAFPTHLIYPEDGGEEFETLISTWANTAEGQVLSGRGLWVAQIGRYTHRQGEWTKHHKTLQVPTIFQLPVCLDGVTATTEQYSLIGLLCHSGDAHHSGHFYAIFVYRGLYWLVDDGSYPRALPVLQENIKQQIVQVWAIPSAYLLPDHIPSDFPTQTQGSQSAAPERKRRKQDHIDFTFANVTSLGQAVRQWIGGRTRSPLFIAETHLAPDDHHKTMQWLCGRGFGVLGAPAAQSPKGGTHGGLMIVYPAHLRFHQIHQQMIDGCGWVATMWTFSDLKLIMIVAYFKCGEGVQGKTNSALWCGLISFVTGVNHPCIIMGDFNINPGEFMATTMGTVMQVQMVATD